MFFSFFPFFWYCFLTFCSILATSFISFILYYECKIECSECKIEYGSCDIFKHYPINVKHLNKTTLWSSTVAENTIDNADASIEKAVNDFLVPRCICAIAIDDKSTDTVCFLKIIERCEADKQCIKNYVHTVAQGNEYFSGKYLEQDSETRHKTSFKEMKKTMFLYRTSVVYPFVNFEKSKNLFHITKAEYFEVLLYIGHFGMTSL